MYVGDQQHVKKSLSGVNHGVLIGSITAAIITAADTFAGLYAAVAAFSSGDIEEAQDNVQKVLPALNQGANLAILTDANILNLTTVAGLQGLFTAQDPTIPLTYTASAPE